ncbi:MAG: hypothetical protein ACR2RV_05060 [Verrucomicrobiales bacterium]
MKYFISQYWKIIVGLISIFIGGLGFGGVLESLRHRESPVPSGAARSDVDWIESTLASLDQSLALSEEQVERLRPKVEATANEIQLSRQSALLKFELSLLELHRSIAPDLDDAQQKTLGRSQKELEERIRLRTEALLSTAPSVE